MLLLVVVVPCGMHQRLRSAMDADLAAVAAHVRDGGFRARGQAFAEKYCHEFDEGEENKLQSASFRIVFPKNAGVSLV